MAERVVTAHIYLYLTVRQEQTRCGSRGVREIFPSFTTPGLFLRGRSDLSVIYRDTTSHQSAAALWEKIPVVYRERATFYTDQYEVYKGVIPPAQHRAITKLARKTNHVECFNCTLRQRVSRLVRVTLSFSKKLSNHIGAIRYFICDYNLTRCAALPG